MSPLALTRGWLARLRPTGAGEAQRFRLGSTPPLRTRQVRIRARAAAGMKRPRAPAASASRRKRHGPDRPGGSGRLALAVPGARCRRHIAQRSVEAHQQRTPFGFHRLQEESDDNACLAASGRGSIRHLSGDISMRSIQVARPRIQSAERTFLYVDIQMKIGRYFERLSKSFTPGRNGCLFPLGIRRWK